MKIYHLLLISAAQAMFSYPQNGYPASPKVDQYQRIYTQYMNHYQKSYENQQEYAQRFSIFSAKLDSMLDPNIPVENQISFAGLSPYQPVPIQIFNGQTAVYKGALNGFADLSFEEFYQSHTIPQQVFQVQNRKSNLSGLKRRFPSLGSFIDKVVAEKRDVLDYLDDLFSSDDRMSRNGVRGATAQLLRPLRKIFGRRSWQDYQNVSQQYSPNSSQAKRLLPYFTKRRRKDDNFKQGVDPQAFREYNYLQGLQNTPVHKRPAVNPYQPSPQPFQQPNQPFPQPNQPFQQPNQSFQQPNQSFQQPNQPFQQPNQSFQQPNQPFQQPNQSFQQPNQSFPQPNQPMISIAGKMYPVRVSYASSIGPPLDQGKCNSCYIFGPLNAITAQHAITSQQRLVLSPQEPLDCVPSNDSCKGGDPYEVLQYIMTYGISLYEHYPYLAYKSHCKRTAQTPVFNQLAGFVFIRPGVLSIIEAVQRGVVGIIGYASKKLMHYVPDTGVFYDDTCRPQDLPNHTLLVYGYNFNTPEPYFNVQNTWGRKWSATGTFKIRIGPLVDHNPLFCGFAATGNNFVVVTM